MFLLDDFTDFVVEYGSFSPFDDSFIFFFSPRTRNLRVFRRDAIFLALEIKMKMTTISTKLSVLVLKLANPFSYTLTAKNYENGSASLRTSTESLVDIKAISILIFSARKMASRRNTRRYQVRGEKKKTSESLGGLKELSLTTRSEKLTRRNSNSSSL